MNMQSFNQSDHRRTDLTNDPFAMFFNVAEDDYIFQIDQLPYALRKMEKEEKVENKERVKEMAEKKQHEKVQRQQKFIPKELLEHDLELGYFAELDATFKSTTDEIESNYLKKTALVLKDC